MLPVVTAAEMRALDRATSDEVGIPGFTLMEVAGRAVADAAVAMLGDRRGHVAVVCGPGNNGGDGYVVARVLRARGIDAVAYVAVKRESVAGDAKAHLAVLERSGGVIRDIVTPAALDQHKPAIAGADLVVDALFGIGVTRAVEGHHAAVIAAINAARLRLAVDIPSGLDSDTGRTMGAAVSAHRTVTMGPYKIALVGAPGFARCGEVEIADIGIPPALIATSTVRAGVVEGADVLRWLPRAGALDHKGTRGHLLVIGGTPEMRGAGRLAANAALRAGAGLVTLAGEGAVVAADSVMTRELHDKADLLGALEGKAAVVIGPGLGTGNIARAWVAEILAAGVPAVFDADALNVLAPEALAGAAGPVIITPHPGEAARLLGSTAAEIEADRLAAARTLAARTHAVVLLKGARSIVCDGTLGDDYCAINPTGSPALGTAGSGDVLAGVVGALLAQQLAPGDAARTGAWVHGRAGEELAAVHGARGVISADMPEMVARVIRDLR